MRPSGTFPLRHAVAVIALALLCCVVGTSAASSNADHECYVAVNSSALVTDIGLVEPNRWGSQPAFMAERPGGPSSAAAAEVDKLTGTPVAYHAIGMMPTVYVQAMTTPQATAENPRPDPIPLDPKIATPTDTAPYTVAYRLESLRDPPFAPQPWAFSTFGVDAIAPVTVDARTGPVAGTWQLALYLWFNGTIATGSSRLASVTLNVTRDASLPTLLSFAPRFVAGDAALVGGRLPSMWDLAQGTRGIVEDERESSVPFEGARVCATMNKPLRPFAVHADFSDGRYAYAPSDLEVRVQYFDTVVRRLSTAGLANNTARLSARGRAVFPELVATTNLGTVEAVLTLHYAPTGAALPVSALSFRLHVQRVLQPECAVTFLKRRSPEAYYLPEPTAATTLPRVGVHHSPLEVVAGQRLPAVSVALIDSSWGLNAQTNNGVMVVEAIGGATVLSGGTAPIVHGIATFEDIMLDPSNAVRGSLVHLRFRVATLGSREAEGVLPTATLPLRVRNVATSASFYVRPLTFFDFLPTATFMPFEGAIRTVRVGDTLPAISLVAGDALDAEYTRAVTGLTAHVRCLLRPSTNATAEPCTLSGTLSQPFKADGTVDFSDLVFPTPMSDPTVRLEFHVTDSTTNPARTAVVNRYCIATGPMRVLARFDSPLVVGADLYRDAHAIFWQELDRSPVLVGREATFPPVIIRLTGFFGAEVLEENEVSVEARAAGGECIVHGGLAYAHRGLAQFPRLSISGCNDGVSMLRLAFTVGREGRFNRAAGHTIVTGPLHLAPAEVIPGALRVDSPDTPFLRHAESAVIPAGGTIPAFRVGVYSSAFGKAVRVAASGVGGRATLGHGPNTWITFGGTTDVPLVAGRAELRGITPQIPRGDVASLTVRVCITGLAAPCVRRRLVILSNAKTTGFVTDAPLPLPETAADEVETTAANMSFTAGFGTYEASTGNLLIVDVSPTTTDLNETVRLMASEPLQLLDSPELNPPAASINSSGLVAMTPLNFVDPATVLRGGLLTLRSETLFTPVASEGRVGATMFPPLRITDPPGPAGEGLGVTVDVIKPLRLFRLERWLRAVALEFQVSPQQLRVERVTEAALTSNRRARTTRVELRVVPGRPQDPLNRDVRLVVEQLLAFRSSCAQSSELDIKSARLTGTPAPSASGCDSEALREWSEAARHCEAFLGRGERCNCFTNVFAVMGHSCRADAQMPGLCVYLAACSTDTINDICDDVVPSRLLRIVLVVGGTIVALALITVIVKLNTSNTPLRRTETLRVEGNPALAKKRLVAEDEHFNEVFI